MNTRKSYSRCFAEYQYSKKWEKRCIFHLLGSINLIEGYISGEKPGSYFSALKEICDLKGNLVKNREICNWSTNKELPETYIVISSLEWETHAIQKIPGLKESLEEEIDMTKYNDIVFTMKRNKSKGSYGYSYEFIKPCWECINI